MKSGNTEERLGAASSGLQAAEEFRTATRSLIEIATIAQDLPLSHTLQHIDGNSHHKEVYYAYFAIDRESYYDF